MLSMGGVTQGSKIPTFCFLTPQIPTFCFFHYRFKPPAFSKKICYFSIQKNYWKVFHLDPTLGGFSYILTLLSLENFLETRVLIDFGLKLGEKIRNLARSAENFECLLESHGAVFF